MNLKIMDNKIYNKKKANNDKGILGGLLRLLDDFSGNDYLFKSVSRDIKLTKEDFE